MTEIAKSVAALAIAGLLLLLLTRIEWVQAPPMSGPAVRSAEPAGSAPPSAAEERRSLEDWHGNVFVTPRTRDGASR